MAITSADVTAVLGLGYPIGFVTIYLAASIIFKVREVRGDSNARPQNTAAGREKVVFCLLCFFCIELLAAIGIAVYADWAWKDLQYWWTSKSYLASQIAVFLLFFSSLLPDPDTPYCPSTINVYTWLTSLTFEILLAVRGTLNLPEFSAAPAGLLHLYRACVILGYVRILCLFLCCAVAYKAPEKGRDSERSALLGTDEGDGSHYGTTESPSKTRAPPIDAQSTNWLDYLVGFTKLFPLLWPATSALQIRAIICILLLIAQRVVNVLVPFQLGAVVASLGVGAVPYRQIFMYVCLRVLQGQQGVLGSIRALLWIPIGQATYRRLTESAFCHVLSLSLEFHLGKRLGEVMSALSKGSALNTFLDSLIFQLFPMVADVGVAAGYLLVTFDPFYALIIITMGWTYLFVTVYMAKYRGRARREMINRDREMDAVKTDAIMSYEVVQYNDAVLAEQSRFSDRVTAFQKAEYSVLVSLNTLNGVQNLIFTLGVLLVSLVSAFNISIGAETVAVFVSLITYLVQLQAPLSFFGSFYTQIQNNLIDAERMLALFNEKPTVVDKPGAIDMKEVEGRVTFEDVSFAYDNRKPALKHVSFTVKPGTSVAIVGESGSGKSTLLRLLYRFYNVNSGCIKIDGRPVEDITIESLRSHFGVVPQETMLFNDTLMYNLLYANPLATEEQVYAACKAASVHDKIMAFPDLYETQVGERGLRLSGGEKQRIAIARAILKSPRIILMDEATASLDSATEKNIQNSLAELSKGRTIITIAHRLSTVVDCDEIIVLHQGKIVEQGTHAQLLAKKGRYKQMWEKQTKESS